MNRDLRPPDLLRWSLLYAVLALIGVGLANSRAALHLWWIRLDEVSRLWLLCLPVFAAVAGFWWWCRVGQFRPRR